jgi:hypothetical protein
LVIRKERLVIRKKRLVVRKERVVASTAVLKNPLAGVTQHTAILEDMGRCGQLAYSDPIQEWLPT